MAATSGSLTFNLDSVISDCSRGEVITFELISEYQPATRNWTGSLTTGQLTLTLQTVVQGGYPFATSSEGNWIIETQSPNKLILNTSLAGYYGEQYQQIPIWTSGSTDISSSLYYQYGEINYPFSLTFGDRILIQSQDGHTQLFTFKNTFNPGDGQLGLEVLPDINDYFLNNAILIDTVLMVKKIEDEQNIILQFNKPPGDTSYGFIISNDIDLKLLNNISALQANVQNQLLSTQQNSQ